MNLSTLVKVASLLGLSFLGAACSVQHEQNNTWETVQDQLQLGYPGPKLVVIPKGTGWVGGVNFRSFQNESPEHKITVSKRFAIGQAEVTFDEYDAFCKATNRKCPPDNRWGRGKQPVIKVSWIEAAAYTQWLSEQTGEVYRLPSEAEWEYAARAGQKTRFWWGDDYIQGVDHCDRDYEGCPEGTAVARPGVAGRFKANPFGLFDVTSNVAEWVLDCGNDSHIGAGESVDPRLDGDCSQRILKGATWQNPQPNVHLSQRISIEKDYRSASVGFRVVREITD
ncbi:MAG: formylglycine-generating enzyme family protein [Pseudomonadales bacterium]|nr:formylglycine-generating enzyme family protein [Pseudomonadales bacterium]